MRIVALIACLAAGCDSSNGTKDTYPIPVDLGFDDSGTETTLDQSYLYLRITLPIGGGATWDPYPVFDVPGVLQNHDHFDDADRSTIYNVSPVAKGTTHITILGRIPGQNTNRSWTATVHVDVPEWEP